MIGNTNFERALCDLGASVKLMPLSGETLFTSPYGIFAYRRMYFGLCNVPATFQSCMQSIFSDFIENITEIFMDDLSVYGTSFDICFSNLSKVL